MRRGVVMEVNDPYVTLLTSEGEFLRARKMDRSYSLGEEIDFFPITDHLQSPKTKLAKNFFSLKTVWMAIAVLVISIGSIIPVYQNNKAYAYMSIDTSTSIEMGLNKNMQVVELKGFNKEAEEIISQLDNWKKMNASELTTIILKELKDDGQITLAKPAVITTVKTNELKDSGTMRLKENIEEIKQKVDKSLVELHMYTSTEAEVEKAQDSGVPVGVYHWEKNKSALKKQTKEKIKSTKEENDKSTLTTPAASTSTTALPSGQQKKQAQDNENINNNQQQNVPNVNNQDKHPIATQQGKGKQSPPGLNNNAKDKGNPANPKESNKQEKQNANKQNNSNNQENNRNK